MLKPQDVVILLKLVTQRNRQWKYSQLAGELHISPSEIYAGVRRLVKSSLLTMLKTKQGLQVSYNYVPDIKNICDFYTHGLRFVFPLSFTEPTCGLPTSFAVEHLFNGLDCGNGIIPVWELENGSTKGIGIKPLYPTVPLAAIDDFNLYELLALTDAVRSDDAVLRDFALQKFILLTGGASG